MYDTIRVFIESDSALEKRISGIGYSTISILEELNKLAHRDPKLEVVSIVPNTNDLPLELKKLKNIKYKKMPGPYRYTNYLLTKLKFGLPADLIFGKGLYIFPNFKNWYLARSKSITFVHDLAYLRHPETVEVNNAKYLNSHMDMWLKRTSTIACISNSTKDDVLKYFNKYKDKLQVIHLGVDTKKYSKLSPTITKRITDKYGLPQNYILSVGNLEPRKNLDTLLRAYQSIYHKNENTPPLALVGGNGWLNQSTLLRISRMQKEGIPVYRNNSYVTNEDMPSIFSAASILVHPAIYEGFGLPILQAMSCGTPVLCSNASSMPEVGGTAVEYFDPNSHEDLEKKLTGLLKSDARRSELSSLGLIRSSSFTWKNVVENILTINIFRGRNIVE